MRGAGGLTAAELIALVWGSGTRGRSAVDLAADALARHDGLTGLARATELELAEVTGIGAAKAAQLVAAFELGRRLLADWPTARWTIRGPHDVADRLILQMGRLEREELRVVLLDTKNDVLRVATVYQGNVSSSLVRVGELFRDAVRLNAAGVILVHNHPSGDPTPSPGRPPPDRRGARRRAACSTSSCSTTWSSATTRTSRCATAAWRSTGPTVQAGAGPTRPVRPRRRRPGILPRLPARPGP